MTIESIRTIDNELQDSYELELDAGDRTLYVSFWPSIESGMTDSFTVATKSYFDHAKTADFIEHFEEDEPTSEAFMAKVRSSKYWKYYELLMKISSINDES